MAKRKTDEQRARELEIDSLNACIITLRRDRDEYRARCDELFSALCVCLSVSIDPDTGDAAHASEQHLLDWARSFVDQKTAARVAAVASYKYARPQQPTCHHDWAYDHHRGGMLCGTCGLFESDIE